MARKISISSTEQSRMKLLDQMHRDQPGNRFARFMDFYLGSSLGMALAYVTILTLLFAGLFIPPEILAFDPVTAFTMGMIVGPLFWVTFFHARGIRYMQARTRIHCEKNEN